MLYMTYECYVRPCFTVALFDVLFCEMIQEFLS